MGCGASSGERADGTAVTGKWGAKVEMPEGVYAEQICGGWKPGSKMIKFTPVKVGELLTKYEATELYTTFQAEIAQDCGGSDMTGWKPAKIQEKVENYDKQWTEKKIKVEFHYVTWVQMIHNGQAGATPIVQHRYWMTFADMDVVKEGAPKEFVYDAKKDYENPPKEEEPKTA